MSQGSKNRREFLADVSRGMLVAGVGISTAIDLGLTSNAFGSEPDDERLSLGRHDRLASLMQETPPDRLLPKLVDLFRNGTTLQEMIAAAALANARAFGGEDYVGFHTFMAMMPAYRMSMALPENRRALPVLKVLYRNAARMQETGRHESDTLAAIEASEFGGGELAGQSLRNAVHDRDVNDAERILSGAIARSADSAWNDLLPVVHEAPEVHRIVLAHRAWDMLHMVGFDHAATMLRQSVRYCIRAEEPRSKYYGDVPALLTKSLEQHKLIGREIGTKDASDEWVGEMVETLLTSNSEQAADAVAAALAEGISAKAISEAICLTANQLVLRDPGRTAEQSQPNKPAGSVHGDSIGVHASDSANAWRHVAQASNPRNAMASLILAGWQVAHDRISRGGRFSEWSPRPLPEFVERVRGDDPSQLLTDADGAIREGNQEEASAVVHRYLELGHPEKAVFAMLLRHSTSEDGALHAEKYFWTVSDEFALTRPAFRNRQLVGLTRVVASEYGTRAGGYEEACQLLGCDV